MKELIFLERNIEFFDEIFFFKTLRNFFKNLNIYFPIFFRQSTNQGVYSLR